MSRKHIVATLKGLVKSLDRHTDDVPERAIPIASLQYVPAGDTVTFEYHGKDRRGRIVEHDYIHSRTLVQGPESHPKWYSWAKADEEQLVYQSV